MSIGGIYESLNDRFLEHKERCPQCSEDKGNDIHSTDGLCTRGAELWQRVLDFDEGEQQ